MLGGATAASSSSGRRVCWLLTANSTAGSALQSISPGVTDGGDGQGDRLGRRLETQPLGPEDVQVLAAGDQGHVQAGLEQAPADHPPDGPGAEHHVAHGRSSCHG